MMKVPIRWLLRLLPLALLGSAAQAERFDMESAIVDSSTSKAVGGGKKTGDIGTFFTAQKEMVYGTLSDLGIALDSLPLDVRKSLERFQTTNFAAFQAFSLGLNAQDHGQFVEAKAFFEKAVQLDPNFELAGELVVAMPNSNVTGTVQLQAALAAAAKAATSSGKVQVEIDLSGAIAALQSGQTVVLGSKPDAALSTASSNAAKDYTSNPPGSSTNYAERKVVGVSYVVQGSGVPVSVASTNEWMLTQVTTDGAGLAKVGDSAEFLASRGSAADSTVGSVTLGDGSTVRWGAWQANPGNFSVTAQGATLTGLGTQFQYVVGDATRTMPSTGRATFTPAGGFLGNVSGNIGIDFVNRNVQINNLGFTLGGMDFSALNGATTYSSSIASGFFKGNYAAGGVCSGAACTGFSSEASAFTGNFLGKGASGLLFSTVMSTTGGTASGVHVFRTGP